MGQMNVSFFKKKMQGDMQVSVLQDIVIVFKFMLVAIQVLAALFWQNDDFFTKKKFAET